jgi:tRNA A37 threonylcarbamoyladenosine dehydratase
MRQTNRIAIIGCGGVTSHLLGALHMSHDLTLYDGDTFEKKNTLRQIGAYVGESKNKAQTYVEMFGKFAQSHGRTMTAVPSYIGPKTSIPDVDILLVAVDNHDARIYAKGICDRQDIPMIWGANEEEDPQALMYLPEYAGTPLDPFVRFNIQKDGRGPGESCTTVEAVAAAPQLPVANHNAASFMLWLLNAYQKINNPQNMPIEVTASRNLVFSKTVKTITAETAEAKPSQTLYEV